MPPWGCPGCGAAEGLCGARDHSELLETAVRWLLLPKQL